MSNEINDGGPAFPGEASNRIAAEPNQGMSLRDYFAAKAMQGLMSDPMWLDDFDSGDLKVMHDLATCAFGVADAMLAARAKGGGA